MQWGKHGRQAMRVGIRLFADTADTVFSHPDLISQLGSDEGSRHSEVNFSITLITSISLAGCCHLFTFIMLGRLGKEEENCIPRKSSKAICILHLKLFITDLFFCLREQTNYQFFSDLS